MIDEAQDLDPTVLRLLVYLCKAPNRVFVAADANQSIWGSTFRWADVHQDLRFRGRTATLWVNRRSTCEIGEAAYAYLRGGALESVEEDRQYAQAGAKPTLCVASSSDEEADILTSFLPMAARNLGLGLGACAVFVPTQKAGEELAMRLRDAGIPARSMTSRDLDLDRPVVKVFPQKSIKGLEFPVVALAGFIGNAKARTDGRADVKEHEEGVGLERRTMFVAMTRAMRALLVIIPEEPASPALQGFDKTHWTWTSPVLEG